MISFFSDQHKATPTPHHEGKEIWQLLILHQEVPVDSGAAPAGQRHQPQQGQQSSDILLGNKIYIMCKYIDIGCTF